MIYDLSGEIFGRWHVVGRGRSDGRHSRWRCVCDCGAKSQVRGDHLRSGASVSCGCLHRELSASAGVHHQPGERFGRLTIIKCVGHVKKRGRLYLCECACPKHKRVVVQGRHLRSGETKSCGCVYAETRATSNLRHGQSRIRHATAAYAAYTREKSWCRNPRSRVFCYYGGRGIEFRFENFRQFYSEIGDKPGPDYWLMRSDSDGHFQPGNLQWVPRRRRVRKEQSR
jgi:hypothetical protein